MIHSIYKYLRRRENVNKTLRSIELGAIIDLHENNSEKDKRI